MERLVKLIPGEIVPVYTLVREQGGDLWMTVIWPLIFLVLTFAFRVYITGGNFFGWVVEAGNMSGLMLVFMLIISKWWQGD